MHQHVNQHELRVIGMSRSGNHAIIQWIMHQTTGRVCFLNCTEGKCNPFQTARVMDDGRVFEANYRLNLEREQQGQFSRKDYLIFSHEDGYLGRSCSREFEQNHDAWVGSSRQRYDVLILRDPFNLFASRLRQLWRFVTLPISVRIWKQHAREFLGETTRLRHNPLRISYNRWRSDPAYRQQIATHLNLNFTDEGIHDVVSCNGGSSFDGLNYNGKAGRMKVLERWNHYADDSSFRELFDDEVFELSERIFGVMPGTEALRRRRGIVGRAG
jgi:hypothetical protein